MERKADLVEAMGSEELLQLLANAEVWQKQNQEADSRRRYRRLESLYLGGLIKSNGLVGKPWLAQYSSFYPGIEYFAALKERMLSEKDPSPHVGEQVGQLDMLAREEVCWSDDDVNVEAEWKLINWGTAKGIPKPERDTKYTTCGSGNLGGSIPLQLLSCC